MVTVHTGLGYLGNSYPVTGSISWVGDVGVPNDAINSVQVQKGYKVELFTEKGFQGRRAVLYRPEPNLERFKFHNSISSIKVSWVGENSYPNEYDPYSWISDNPIGKIVGGVLSGGLSGAGEVIGKDIKINGDKTDTSKFTGSFLDGLKNGFLSKTWVQVTFIGVLSLVGLLMFKRVRLWLFKFLK